MLLPDGVVDRDVALEGDAHRHEDGGAHRHELERVKPIQNDLKVSSYISISFRSTVFRVAHLLAEKLMLTLK